MKVSNERIKREPGYLYYLGKDGYVWATPMRSNKGGKKHKAGTEKVTREPGYLYFVDSAGYIAKVPQKRGAGRKKKMGAKIMVGGDFKATTKYKQDAVPKYKVGKKRVF
jgi:hypothetical protein